MMMQRLFRAAGDLLVSTVRNGVEIGLLSAAVIYGADAYNGHYCVPASSRYAPVRFVATAANHIVNGVLEVSGSHKAQCSVPRYFDAPTRGEAKAPPAVAAHQI